MLETLLVLAFAAVMLIAGMKSAHILRRQLAISQARHAKDAFAFAVIAYYEKHLHDPVLANTITVNQLVQEHLLQPSLLKNKLLTDWQAHFDLLQTTTIIYSAKLKPFVTIPQQELALNLAATLTTKGQLEWQQSPRGIGASTTTFWMANANLHHFTKHNELNEAHI